MSKRDDDLFDYGDNEYEKDSIEFMPFWATVGILLGLLGIGILPYMLEGFGG